MALERLNRPKVYGSVPNARNRCLQLIFCGLLLICNFALAKPPVYDISRLINAQQLNLLMRHDSNWLLIDVRPTVQYMFGHIPNAHNLWRPDYEADKREYSIQGMRASQQKIARMLSQFGATPSTKIILYDDHDNADSARLWWILQLYGHKNTLLLNGGLMGWERAGLNSTFKIPTTPTVSHYTFDSKSGASELLANLNDVKAALTDKNAVILDVRSEKEATGQQIKSGAYRKGRIPHSQWMHFTETMDDDGFRNKQELESLFTERGINKDKKIIIYCQSGVRSANTLFVLKELLSYPDVRNYDGSWIEWSSIKELPVASGQIASGSIK